VDCITREKDGRVIGFVPTAGLFLRHIFPISNVEAQGGAASPQHHTSKKLACKANTNISSYYMSRFFFCGVCFSVIRRGDQKEILPPVPEACCM